MRFRIAVLAALAIAIPGQLSGQAIKGILLDQETGQSLAGGTMTLLTSDSIEQASTVTDSLGEFFLSANRAAPYLLRAEIPGFLSSTSPALRLNAGDTLNVEFSISTAAVVLDPLVVRGTKRLRGPLAGFYRRMDRNAWGSFITREEIEQRHPHMITEMLRMIPGIQLVPRPFAPGNMVVMRGTCMPNIFVDGMGIRLWGASIDDLVRPLDLEGIEVYRSVADIPVEYGGLRGACGAILLWTRRG